jgi:sec-independent protein translocase protein TatA
MVKTTDDGAWRQRRMDMLNNIGLPGLLLIAIVVLVLFGRGKISSLMGEVGKGITAFKRGVDDGKRELDDSLAEPRDVTPAEEKEKNKV